MHGHRTLTNLLKPWEPNLLKSLREAGYRVAWAGERGDTFAPGVTEQSVDEYGWVTPPQAGPLHYPDSPMARAFYIGRRDEAGAFDFDEATTTTACQWLRDPPLQSWAAFVTFIFPHVPFYVEEPWFSLHDRRGMRAPRERPRGPVPRYVDAVHDRYGLGALSLEEWAEIAATYHGMVSRVDAQVGRLLEALDQGAGRGNTVIVFLTDHGEYLGDYGLIEKWPSGLHDCLVRNPLIFAGPGIASGQTCDSLIEMVDLVRTIAELASCDLTYTHFGKSLVPLLEGSRTEVRDAVFSEGGFLLAEEPLLERAGFPYDLKACIQHEEPLSVGKAVAMRDRDWTYVLRLYERDELYSRTADPDETVNLIDEPRVASVSAQCRERILRWLLETSDVIPWATDPRRPLVAGRTFGGAERHS